MIRLIIDFTATGTDTGWSILYSVEDPPQAAAPLLQAGGGQWQRDLSIGQASGISYPVPSSGQASAGTGPLASAPPPIVDVGVVLGLHKRIAALSPDNGDLPAFGRYLFDVLLGQDLWQDLLERAGKNTPIELAVALTHDEKHLQKLPWEMAHNGQQFLAQIPGISFVRRVKGGQAPSQRKLASPPRVLFCVGAGLDDDVIRPGAEYLGLLRSLKVKSHMLRLRTHLLQKASTGRLEAAIKSYSPDVVHFICHGNRDENGEPFLEMIDDNNPGTKAMVYAPSLLQALRAGGDLPPVVVIGACRSAEAFNPKEGQIPTSLAAYLVKEGVPVVVGMSGRVSDQACRLFSRRFYEALLEGTDIASATAQGRLAALRDTRFDPDTSPDWTLPAIFTTNDGTWSGLHISPDPAAKVWYQAALNDAPGPFPAFCDRIEALERLDYVLAPRDLQQILEPSSPGVQVMAVSVDISDDAARLNGKYGRTWLLQEMAGKAFQDGHAACLLDTRDPQFEMPKVLEKLFALMNSAVTRTEKWLGLPVESLLRVLRLLKLAENDGVPETMEAEIRNAAFGGSPKSPQVLAAACRLDLVHLLEKCRVIRPRVFDSDCCLLLLVDDLHRMGAMAVKDFLYAVLADLRTDQSIRVVFTYSTVPVAGQESTIQVIEDWFGKVNNVIRYRLGPFRPSGEDVMAYQHFLLNWRQEERSQRRPLWVLEGRLKKPFFKSFSKDVDGVPSRLHKDGSKVVEIYLEIDAEVDAVDRVFADADDDKILEEGSRLARDRI